MQNKNVDGIVKAGNSRQKVAVRVLTAHSVIKHQPAPVVVKRLSYLAVYRRALWRARKHALRQAEILFAGLRSGWQWAYARPRVPVMAAVVALVLAFGGGMWAVLTTSRSSADDTVAAAAQNFVIPISSQGGLGPASTVPNEVLFNMTMSQLENYFNDLSESNRQVAYEELLADRKTKLKAFLQEKKSPLADIVDTIAELKHWKIVLAVSNSESSLGKRCYDNNCSGIGVEPGHPLWREYPSKREWAIDLDRLIEKRYKDWTLEQMNGVYNYPGSQNWVTASTQILEQLQQRGIE